MAVRPAFERSRDPVEHCFEFELDFVVPEADDLEAARPEERGADRVVAGGVLHSIDFDDQSLGHAGEIGDIGTDRYLPIMLFASRKVCVRSKV